MFTLCIDLLFAGKSFEKSKSVNELFLHYISTDNNRQKHLMYFALCPDNKKLLISYVNNLLA